MSRRGLRLIVVAVAFVAAAFVLPAAASAAMTNSDCLGCHTSIRPQNFDVGTVDRDTACRKCHNDGFVGSHPYHNVNGNCGAACHPGFGAALGSNVPSVVTTGGAFATAVSQDTPAALLHIIHSKAQWESSIIKGGTDCGSCHAVAACTACHENTPAPDTTHANHASLSPTVTPWVGDVAYGSAIGKVTNATIRCGAVGCHDTNKVSTNTPSLREERNFPAAPADGYTESTVVTAVGTWNYKYGIAYTAGVERVSNAAGASLSTTFNGERVVLVSDKDPYRGIAQIYIDGTPVDTVDLYRVTTKYQVPVWTSPTLAAGAHTIMVKPTGTKNASARATFVSVDQFKVYGTVPGSISPTCVSCHTGQATNHGTYTWPHEATQTAGVYYNGGTGNYRCDSCHSMVFVNEHNRTTSSSAGKSCSNCHSTYAPMKITGSWVANDGCNYQQCHATATPRQPHASITASHTVPTDASLQPCRDCHAGDLAVIHNNSITTNAYTTTCNTCHTPSKFPTTNNCADTAGCHTVSGISIVDDHPQNATFTTRHTASSMTSTTQSPGPDGAIYTATKNCSACHSAKLTTAHATTSIGAISCTSGGTGNTGCHFNTSLNSMSVAKTGWTTDKCAECHDYGTAKTHDTATTAHVVVAGTCAGTGSMCHNYTDLAELHSKSWAGGVAKYSSCSDSDLTDPTGCHSLVDKRPARWATDATSCGLGSNGCHQEKTTTNHGMKHALNLTGSDFNVVTQTGCTNSGAGCHGSSTSVNISDYHPTSGCAASVCHTSASKASHHETFLCIDCHDGTYVGAADTTALVDVNGAGHYNETTHTVSALAATINAGGTYTAACSDCHTPGTAGSRYGLYNQHQGIASAQVSSASYTDITCYECHNRSAAISTLVTDATRTDTCAACHTAAVLPGYAQHGNAPVVTGTEAQGAGTCVAAGCHATTDLHALHKSNIVGSPENGCTMTGCHDATKQGAKPTSKSCGTGGTCHLTDAHGPKHDATSVDTGGCIACHEITDIRTQHANNCALCHNAGTNLGGQPGNTADCVTCHTVSDGMAYNYGPYNPNHYNAWSASHQATSSVNATTKWGTTTYGATLKYYYPDSSGNAYEVACTACHTTDLMTEHTKSTVSTSTMAAYLNVCVGCHELKVDNFTVANPYTGGCGGTADVSCHNMGTTTGGLHRTTGTGWAEKHDASSVQIANPGLAWVAASSSAATLETQDFGTTTTWPTDWTRESTTYIRSQTTRANAGAAGEIYATSTTRRTFGFYKDIDLSTATGSATLTFYNYCTGITGGTDYARVEYSTDGGSTYTQLYNTTTNVTTWTLRTYTLPTGGSVRLRFSGSVSSTTDFVDFDDILVTGTVTTPGSWGTALPANSTAAVSCSSNPSATQCHDVSDIADLHSDIAGRTDKGCPICHTSNSVNPTVKNCQDAACHGTSMNGSGHATTWHESAISNDTYMGTTAGEFSGTWCKGCHDDSIDDEHNALSAYTSTPCSVCHKKTANSAAPTSVTAANTAAAIRGDSTVGNALCTDCHKTVTKASPHVQRMGTTTTLGSTQFDNTWSGHRVWNSMYGSRTGGTGSTFNGQTTSITWSLPTATSWLKTGWTTTTMAVRCSDCHGTMTGATGPHGASMSVKLASGYDNSYSDGTLYLTSSQAMSNTTNICAKCHTTTALGYNDIHAESKHYGSVARGRCTNCHTPTPHAWKRPRLIGYMSDPAPYATQEVTGITARSYTPTTWDKSYCGVGGACGSHNGTPNTPLWP